MQIPIKHPGQTMASDNTPRQWAEKVLSLLKFHKEADLVNFPLPIRKWTERQRSNPIVIPCDTRERLLQVVPAVTHSKRPRGNSERPAKNKSADTGGYVSTTAASAAAPPSSKRARGNSEKPARNRSVDTGGYVSTTAAAPSADASASATPSSKRPRGNSEKPARNRSVDTGGYVLTTAAAPSAAISAPPSSKRPRGNSEKPAKNRSADTGGYMSTSAAFAPAFAFIPASISASASAAAPSSKRHRDGQKPAKKRSVDTSAYASTAAAPSSKRHRDGGKPAKKQTAHIDESGFGGDYARTVTNAHGVVAINAKRGDGSSRSSTLVSKNQSHLKRRFGAESPHSTALAATDGCSADSIAKRLVEYSHGAGSALCLKMAIDSGMNGQPMSEMAGLHLNTARDIVLQKHPLVQKMIYQCAIKQTHIGEILENYNAFRGVEMQQQ